MASSKRTKYSVSVAEKKIKIGNRLITKRVFLSRRDEEQGKDIRYDMKGYKVKAL